MWVVDIEKMLDGDEADLPTSPAEEWRSHSIFRVPSHFKMVRGNNAFKPQTVTLGPFHHDRDSHAIMEGHKRTAVRHLLRRAGKPLRELAAAMEEVANEMEDAYDGLDGEWRGRNRGRFLEMMIADGCFLLEVMRNYNWDFSDYTPSDPVFSPHAVVHIAVLLQRDMLMIENQLPLLLLQRIVAVEGRPSDDVAINKLVLGFLGMDIDSAANVGTRLGPGLQPLELYRRSLLGANKKATVPRSAQKLWEAGIRFSPSNTDFLDDVSFHGRRHELRMPLVVLDDSTEYIYNNVMAFEALHAGTGNDVTAFVLFMRDMVHSVDDVARLRMAGILMHGDLTGSNGAVVALLHGLTKDVVKIGNSWLFAVRDAVEIHCRDSWRLFVFESWANLRKTYFTTALTFSIFFLITDLMRTAYAVMSYELTKHRHG
ncbi:unnamed protein product [Urochloa decumbens]|uniref:Uncharacterized protein n=1 Tax=Urochloa decumbens TaxID=240449 RepID=A0ABC9B680_9POAL